MDNRYKYVNGYQKGSRAFVISLHNAFLWSAAIPIITCMEMHIYVICSVKIKHQPTIIACIFKVFLQPSQVSERFEKCPLAVGFELATSGITNRLANHFMLSDNVDG